MQPSSTPRVYRNALTLALAVGTLLTGCAETYCQSGPKYGTQCYDLDALEYQETQVRGETISERYVAGASHPRVGAAGPTEGSPSRRQPAYGAIR